MTAPSTGATIFAPTCQKVRSTYSRTTMSSTMNHLKRLGRQTSSCSALLAWRMTSGHGTRNYSRRWSLPRGCISQTIDILMPDCKKRQTTDAHGRDGHDTEVQIAHLSLIILH